MLKNLCFKFSLLSISSTYKFYVLNTIESFSHSWTSLTHVEKSRSSILFAGLCWLGGEQQVVGFNARAQRPICKTAGQSYTLRFKLFALREAGGLAEGTTYLRTVPAIPQLSVIQELGYFNLPLLLREHSVTFVWRYSYKFHTKDTSWFKTI